MSTIAVVGAGPLLGLSIGRVFGRHGFQVALIARRADVLDGLARTLQAEDITAATFPADITKPDELSAAFARIKQQFGPVDILEFSPTDWGKGKDKNINALATTPETASEDFSLLVLGAIRSAQLVLPDMLQRHDGALFFTTGYSAIEPLPFITSLGIANAGVRNYARCLHQELAPEGIYVGVVAINAFIAEGTDGDPNRIAEVYYDMYTKRDRVESVFSAGVH